MADARPCPAIVRVVDVVDTREFELVPTESGTRWAPIAGTGEGFTCDRCCRVHDVRASVEVAGGAKHLVCPACTPSGRALREAATRVKVAALEAAHLAELADTWRRILSVDTPPAVTWSFPAGSRKPVFRCGETTLSFTPTPRPATGTLSPGDIQDGEDAARFQWRMQRWQQVAGRPPVTERELVAARKAAALAQEALRRHLEGDQVHHAAV